MENWDDVPPDVIRMYARRKPTQEASEEYVMHASINSVILVHNTAFAIQWIPRARWVSGRDVTGHVKQSHSTLPQWETKRTSKVDYVRRR